MGINIMTMANIPDHPTANMKTVIIGHIIVLMMVKITTGETSTITIRDVMTSKTRQNYLGLLDHIHQYLGDQFLPLQSETDGEDIQ